MISKEELRRVQLKMLGMLKDIDNVCEKHNIQYFLDFGSMLGAIRHKGFIPWDDDLDIAMTREDFHKFEKIAQEELGENYFVQTPKTDKKYTIYHVPLKIRDVHSKIIEHDFSDETEFHQGIYVDVFPIDKTPKGKIGAFLCDSYCKIMRYQNIVNKKMKDFTLIKKLMYIILKPIMYIYIRKVKYETRYKIEEKLRSFSKEECTGYQTGLETGLLNKYEKNDLFPTMKVEFEEEYFPVPNNWDAVLKEYYGEYMKIPNEEDRTWHSKEVQFYN